MVRLICVALLILGSTAFGFTGDSGDIFSIYLVRHGEKDANPSDPANPGLSDCGAARAGALAKILADAKLEKIYSSDYERTLATARPIAEPLSLETEIYDPVNLEVLSRLLLKRRQNALVVGHSNTTGVLAGMLTGGAGEAFDEDIYDRLYQVVISGRKTRLNLLHQAFRCGD
jgi:broad specificity phosphatase PhoE